jgi:prophage DNA circulation protein
MPTRALNAAVDKLNDLIGLGDRDDWRKRLRPASFRGVDFVVIDSSLSGGHRNVAHVYPGRRDGYVETLGPEIDTLTISGLIAGNDLHGRRDALIAALRQGGPGTLVDPFLGPVEVDCDSYEKTEIVNQGRMAVFAMTFSFHGDALELTEVSTNSSASLLSEVAAIFSEAAAGLADTISLVGRPAEILNAAINKVKGELSLAATRIQGAAAMVLRAYADLTNQFVIDGDNAGFTEENLLELTRIVGFIPLADVLALSESYTGPPVEVEDERDETPTAVEAANAARIDAYFQAIYLTSAAAAAVDAPLESFDEAVALRDTIVARMSEAALSTLAAQAYDYLSQRAAGLERLADITPDRVTSSLELSYQLYGDYRRADEISDRNRIFNPGFIVHETVKVLKS